MVATPANSINEATVGIVGFTGTAFTASPVTQFDVLVGGSTSSAIGNVAPSATSGVPLISQGAASNPIFGTALIAGGGTASTSFNINGAVFSNTTTTGALQAATLSNGQLLIGSTGAAPAAATLTAGTGITITNAANSITIAASGSASVVSVHTAGSTSVTSTATNFAPTGTTPTTANTVALGTITFAPTNVSNILVFQWTIPYGTFSNAIGVFIFSGSTLIDAFPYAVVSGASQSTISGTCFMTAGTTSSTTYGLYYNAQGNASSIYINETSTPTAFYNGTSAWQFVITEYT